jgi:hypothetical protein
LAFGTLLNLAAYLGKCNGVLPTPLTSEVSTVDELLKNPTVQTVAPVVVGILAFFLAKKMLGASAPAQAALPEGKSK